MYDRLLISNISFYTLDVACGQYEVRLQPNTVDLLHIDGARLDINPIAVISTQNPQLQLQAVRIGEELTESYPLALSSGALTPTFANVTVTGRADFQGEATFEGAAQFKGADPWFDVTHPDYAGGAKGDLSHDDGLCAVAAENAVVASPGGTGTVFYPPPPGGAGYLLNTTVTSKSNVGHLAMPGTVTIKRTIVGDCYATSVGTSHAFWFGFIFDMTGVGWSAIDLIGSDAIGQVTDIRIYWCLFMHPSSVWLVQFNYNIVDPAIPASKNSNVRVQDSQFDNTGQTGSLECLIFINTRDAKLTNVRFVGTAVSPNALLAFYGYCRDCQANSCHFEGWACVRSTYVSQSDAISYNLCEWRTSFDVTCVEIFNGQNIKVNGSPIMTTGANGTGVLIADFAGATFDGHTALYSESHYIYVHGNRGDTFQAFCNLSVAAVQGQTDIFVADNFVSPLRCLFLTTGMPNVPSGTVKRIFVTHNHVISHSGFSGGAACVEIVGNAVAPNGGYQTIVITLNEFPFSAAGGAGTDIEIQNLADDIYLSGNKHTGSATPVLVNAACTNKRIRNNPGYNPVGNIATPAFPATTITYTNTTGFDIVAYITNGANPLTVQVDAAAALAVMPAASVMPVRIPAMSTFKPTYGGGVPTWNFYAE